MNLNHLSDDQVEGNLQSFRTEEKEVVTKILFHMRELERRRLFSKHKLPSLFEYACKKMDYTEDEAWLRISAMRLLKEFPEIAPKIDSGALSLTNLSKVRTLFRKEEKENKSRTREEKLELLAKVERVSKKEAMKTIKQEARVEVAPPVQGPSLEQFSELVQADLRRLMDVMAASRGNMTIDQLVGEISKIALEKLDPMKKAERAVARHAKSEQTPAKNDAPVPVPERVNIHDRRREYINSPLRHAVYMKCRGACDICGGTRYLEIDHVKPVALGGKTELSNLRLLCRSCNQRAAIEKLGMRKMETYLRSPFTNYH